jgi:hypothetical protein
VSASHGVKTTPTDIDREAATLFALVPGVQVWLDRSLPHEDSWGDGVWVRSEGGQWFNDAAAIDTDDPATVGCMSAQVDAKYGGPCMVACGSDVDRSGPLAWAVRAWTGRDLNGIMFTPFGHTRGAALVAAMRALNPAR